MKTWRIAGISFEHFHMGDLLQDVFDHPNATIVGVSDDPAHCNQRRWTPHAK